MKIISFILIFSLFIGFGGYAQNPQAKKEKKDEQVKKAPVSAEEQLQQEIDPNVFIYNPNGRRDPFKSLLQGKDRPFRELEGIAGLTIGELVLEGTMKIAEGKWKAFLKGPKNHPYDVSVGDKVYDGEIIRITANSIVFKQILTVALGGTKEKEVVKWLNPEEEAEK